METNRFNAKEPQYYPSKALTFSVPTSDTRQIVNFSLRGLKRIWRSGYRYKKAGILFNSLHTPEDIQLSLFRTPDDERTDKLMAAMDKLNLRHGRERIRLGSSGEKDAAWAMQSNRMSNRHTTCWPELFTALTK